MRRIPSVERCKAFCLDLSTSEERFRTLTRLSSDWFWEQDRDCRFVQITEGRTAPAAQAVSLSARSRRQMARKEPASKEAASLSRDGPAPYPCGRQAPPYLETRVSVYSKLPPLSVPFATSELPSADSFSSQAVSTLPLSHRPAQPFWSRTLLDSVSAPLVAL